MVTVQAFSIMHKAFPEIAVTARNCGYRHAATGTFYPIEKLPGSGMIFLVAMLTHYCYQLRFISWHIFFPDRLALKIQNLPYLDLTDI
jgi:hypothetical protein